MNKLLTYLLSLCLLASCGVDRLVKKGDKAYAIGEYYVAADCYRRAYAKTPAQQRDLRGQRALALAHSYERFGSALKAAAAYRNAIRYNATAAQDRLNHARLLLRNGDYKAALAEFEMLRDSMPDNELVLNGITSAQNAQQWKQQGSSYTVKKQDIFNSRRDDYSPCLAGDDHDILYFASTRNEAVGDELNGVTGMKSADIFMSQKDERGRWGRPEPITSALNTDYDEGAPYVSPDGKQMYLTQCTDDPEQPRYATVVVSDRGDAAWGAPKQVDISRDTLSAYAHPAVSPDGGWLYFVSDMPGGVGGYDIWRAPITGQTVGAPQNLGRPVNTPGNEMFPTFRPNGDLYFSSDGHPGLGGLDIFIAVIGSDHKYHLTHPGYPLNSNADDFGCTFAGALNEGFFSSNRGDGRGYDHIYSFFNPEVVQQLRGYVYEQEGYELTNAEVRIVGSDGTNRRMGVRADGSFDLRVTPGVSYIALATCPGFLNHMEEVTVPELGVSRTDTLQFALASITAPILVDNIFYEFDRATILPQSATAIDSLASMLRENPNITIELGAHTDSRGGDAYNIDLSQRRAEAVRAYLIRKGIAADRLTAVGYGKSRPKQIRRRVAERYPWLAEGDTLTEAFIARLTPDQQQTANAMNRRTEFRVLRTTYGMFDAEGRLVNPPPVRRPKTEATEDDNLFIFE